MRGRSNRWPTLVLPPMQRSACRVSPQLSPIVGNCLRGDSDVKKMGPTLKARFDRFDPRSVWSHPLPNRRHQYFHTFIRALHSHTLTPIHSHTFQMHVSHQLTTFSWRPMGEPIVSISHRKVYYFHSLIMLHGHLINIINISIS